MMNFVREPKITEIMASKNQTPAPKVSSDANEGRMDKPGTEKIETKETRGNRANADEAMNTQEMQEKHGRDKINREGNNREY
jgi:hypothetical protein